MLVGSLPTSGPIFAMSHLFFTALRVIAKAGAEVLNKRWDSIREGDVKDIAKCKQ
jgi:hypothetical protein